jgi:hypothetical protein
VDTLRKNISGSMEGEASQKDMTGARGTPPTSIAQITGITPQEQKGLKAPMAVAARIAMSGRASNTRPILSEIPDILTATAMGIVISRYGHMWRNAVHMKWAILCRCVNISGTPYYRNYTIIGIKKRGLEHFPDLFLEPIYVILVQADICGSAFGGANNPAGFLQNLQVLRDGGLGLGEDIHDITGDTAVVRDQEFHDLKAGGISQSIEHSHEPGLLRAGNVQCAARLGVV